MDKSQVQLENESIMVTINPEELGNKIAEILVRNSGNKLTVEVLNGIMASIKQDIGKLGGL